MKTIYYLGDVVGKVWDENDLAQVEIIVTTLGREELTLTNFVGDLLHSIEVKVPAKDTDENQIPELDWMVADGTMHQWTSGDPADGLSNSGELVQFPFVLNDDQPFLNVRLTLKLGNAESLPTHVYLETLELGDTSSILIFRNGVNPAELAVKGEIIFIEDFLTSGYDTGTDTISPNIDPIQYEEKYTYSGTGIGTAGKNNLGTFSLKNIGNDEANITSICLLYTSPRPRD